MIGWECPKCGKCYSPFVQACSLCGPDTFTTHWANCTCGTTAVCPLHTGRLNPTVVS